MLFILLLGYRSATSLEHLPVKRGELMASLQSPLYTSNTTRHSECIDSWDLKKYICFKMYLWCDKMTETLLLSNSIVT